jgi:hypothetical protein
VTQTHDVKLALNAFDSVLILENAYWFPQILTDFAAQPKETRPVLAVWHWEPLPLPKAADVKLPSLSLREMAKVVLRDRRATDPYTNLVELQRLQRLNLPDLLIVSSQAWQESLAEHGILSCWTPYGYEPADGAPKDAERDIEVLFLGALNLPRRRKIVRQLQRCGVNVMAKGSWSDKNLWGEHRTALVNRAEAFINIQRYPREIGAHRMILGMANKALVVSEPIYRPAPFIAGEHYVEAEVHSFPEMLAYYRAHPEARDRIVETAFRFVTEELRMENSVKRILSLMEEAGRKREGGR